MYAGIINTLGCVLVLSGTKRTKMYEVKGVIGRSEKIKDKLRLWSFPVIFIVDTHHNRLMSELSILKSCDAVCC